MLVVFFLTRFALLYIRDLRLFKNIYRRNSNGFLFIFLYNSGQMRYPVPVQAITKHISTFMIGNLTHTDLQNT